MPNPIVQGFKLDENGNHIAGVTISVDGNSTGTANPYAGSYSPNASHTFSSSVPAGYSAWYSLCRACTSHPDTSWVSGTSVVSSQVAGSYLDLWWKYYAPPTTFLETTATSSGNFTGWGFDGGSSATSIAVHVYIDGPAGVGTFLLATTANVSRPDVNAAFGITGNHGFGFSLPTQYLNANHTLYVYAISLFNQPNPLIGTGTYTNPNPPPPCGTLRDCCGDGTVCRASCAGVGLMCH